MPRARHVAATLWFVLGLGAATPAPAPGDFALRDHDTVVFLGDSNTAALDDYGKIVERYTLLRFPRRRVRFVNAGISGDTAAGGLARLARDVFERGATVVIVTYGFNDICAGACADEAHRTAYLEAIAGIVRESLRHGVRPYVCTYPVLDEDPWTSERSILQTMTASGMAISQSLGGGAIDVGTRMRELQKVVYAANASRPPGTPVISMHVNDGVRVMNWVHLDDLGHEAMAYAMLKALAAPPGVSSVTIDAGGPSVVAAEGAKVKGLRGSSAALEFERRDEGLPLTFGGPPDNYGATVAFVPFDDDLGRYELAIIGLQAGLYDVAVDGRRIARLAAERLAAGVNLASVTPDVWGPGGPWQTQSTAVRLVADARLDAATACGQADMFLAPGAKGAVPRTRRLLAGLTGLAARTDAALERWQRRIAAPGRYLFVVTHVGP
jgi:hypothetical protein